MPLDDDFGRLYVIEIDTRAKRSRIKVGYTVSPTRRLSQHRATAVAHGCRPGRDYVSPPGSGMGALEDQLINFCKQQPGSRQYCAEYFTGVDFQTTARFAARLCEDGRSLHEWALSDFRGAMHNEAGPGRLLCGVEEAARWLRMSTVNIRELIAAGDLSLVFIGRTERLRVTALEGLLQDPQNLDRPWA